MLPWSLDSVRLIMFNDPHLLALAHSEKKVISGHDSLVKGYDKLDTFPWIILIG